MKKQGALLLVAVSSAFGQGTFQNLDFESANFAGLTNSFVAFSDAFPNWTGYIGTNHASLAGYNFISAGGAVLTLITPSAPDASTAATVISGNCTATIPAGQTSPLGVIVPGALAQTGAIPLGAKSLRFSASGNVDYLSVTFAGVNLPFLAIGTGSNYKIYAGDISALAGVTGELRFTEEAASFEPVVILDDIEFSPVPIPEPSALALSLVAVLLLAGVNVRRVTACESTPRPERERLNA